MLSHIALKSPGLRAEFALGLFLTLIVLPVSAIAHAQEAASTTEQSVPAVDVGAETGTPEAAIQPIVPAPADPSTESDQLTATQPDVVIPPPAPPAAPKPPPQPWKPMFFDNDFRYKGTPNAPHFIGEELKLMPVGDVLPWDIFADSTLSIGGEVRQRYINELNRFRPGGPGRSTYNQIRWRQYADWRINDRLRVYAEMLDGSISGADLPLAGIDINRFDLQNGFVDWQFTEIADRKITARIGRQELLYGAQRLVSPLDWANTRRNFEGIKLFSPGEDWDLDLWLMNPVNTATPNDGPVDRFDHSFDSRNQDHTVGGAWATNKSVQNETLDLFFLYDRNVQDVPNAFPLGERYLLGSRKLVNIPVDGTMATASRVWHWELEGGYQFGHDRGRGVNAGYGTAGVGHTWQDVPWSPNLWMFFDYASGDSDPTDDHVNTFYQYYGLVHAYLGLIDNVARQNIMDLNWRLTLKPTKKLQVMSAIHLFDLASTNDVLYTATGAALGTPHTGRSVGQEYDLVATYQHSPNFSIEAGYFWFLQGDFIDNNAPRGTAEQFYLMSTFRF